MKSISFAAQKTPFRDWTSGKRWVINGVGATRRTRMRSSSPVCPEGFQPQDPGTAISPAVAAALASEKLGGIYRSRVLGAGAVNNAVLIIE